VIRFVQQSSLANGAHELPERYDVAFVGTPMDDRGARCRSIAEGSANRLVSTEYIPDVPHLLLDGVPHRPSDMDAIVRFAPASRVLLDATSLDFVEMLLLCKAYLQNPGVEVGFVYAEPHNYVPSSSRADATADFAFSEASRGTHSVPGFAPELRDDSKGWMFVCVGYESYRLHRILEEDDGAFIRSTTLVFGIPPYKTNWELHALLPHLSLLSDQPGFDIAFAGANNPRATYLELRKTAEAVAGMTQGQLLVAPLGSKPSAIGVVLFSCLRNDIRLKYDFPIRTAGGTVGVGNIYRYLVASGS